MTGPPSSATEAMASPQIAATHLGHVPYEQALAWQHGLVADRLADRVGDLLLTLEHERVYTAGRHADLDRHVRGTTDIPVVPTDRGGDVTYHGPGQLVGYPILRLPTERGVRDYVRALQAACIDVAASYGVTAQVIADRPGVWVGNAKLVAIGVRVQRGVTSHGLAFNVDCELADYEGIVPCGIPDAEVCSLASLGVRTDLEEARARLVPALGRALGRRPVNVEPATLGLPPTAASLTRSL